MQQGVLKMVSKEEQIYHTHKSKINYCRIRLSENHENIDNIKVILDCLNLRACSEGFTDEIAEKIKKFTAMSLSIQADSEEYEVLIKELVNTLKSTETLREEFEIQRELELEREAKLEAIKERNHALAEKQIAIDEIERLNTLLVKH